MKEKQIKIEPADIERLAGIYPDMNEAQLEEIALGEKMGLGFSSYADASLSAEEMKAKREELDDKRHRAVTAFECRYFYGAMKYLDLFMSTREALFESLILEKNGISYKDIERWASSDGQLQGKMNKLYDNLTKDKLVCDIFEDGAKRLPEKYAEIVRGIKVEETPFATAVSFPLTMTADVYKTFGKGAFDTNEKVNVTPETRFIIKNKLASYSETYFSVALNSDEFSIAIAAQPNRSATKSDADLAVAIIDSTHIWYDNAAKYIDVTPFTKGLRS
ncbi:MAG: hypothetical protein E7613_04100 [Ruminococcaceae bacterium]|nr:hypothetical protein [Oscillospiraceae bacterium]